MILFYQGSLIESFYDGGAVVSTGRTAFSLFKNDVDRGEGSMDVIELTPEVVTAIYQLLTAPTILQGLLARFVDVKALLEYLQAEQIHGSLLVRAREEMRIVLMRGGQLLGPFTRGQPPQMTDKARQGRAKKVKELLASTEHNLDALERTIDGVSQTSIMFVDPTRLTNLANEMRQVVEEQR